MRRSLAPSQKGLVPLVAPPTVSKPQKGGDEVTISRMPMFGFLQIPESLNKQFKVPSGCIITEETLRLRKIKSLGGSRMNCIIKPGQYQAFNKPTLMQSDDSPIDEEDNEEEGLPKVNLPPFEPLVLWQDPNSDHKVEVIPELACKLRPHQREGVQFLFECTMGLRGFEGEGCILADDMGLGKTLMSITLLWTLLNQGFVKGASAVTKAVIVCPTSLVGNWDNEIRKWVGERCPTFAVKSEPKKMIKQFVQHRGKAVLIVSYETQRLYSNLFETSTSKAAASFGGGNCCDLLICDEAHKLKNSDSGLSKSLNMLPAKKRVLLSGTPMQNELTEFYNMVNFCNPLIIGTIAEFKKRYERPILASREPDASDSELSLAANLQKELSTIVNEFILKRGNALNAQHLPPKLVQFVCCRLTPLQESLYEALLSSKEMRHVREGKQLNTLNSIRQLINICSHPKMVLDNYNTRLANKEPIDDDLKAMVDLIKKHNSGSSSHSSNANSNDGAKPAMSRFGLSTRLGQPSFAAKSSADQYCDPEQSGKMSTLFRMIQTMKAVKQGERIVVVSNYTQTLDLIEQMCTQNNWNVLRLDGTVGGNKRTKLVAEFNDPTSSAFVFLLSSKAGGCGINLIGGSRLVLFDPDWNPASDKQAAARIWREGQKRRCFIYRFMSSGTIEEKIIQRQLSKEGLADIVDNKDQVNVFSTDELRQLFEFRKDTRSDTHDTLRCKRCNSVKVLDYKREKKQFHPSQIEACEKFLNDFIKFLDTESTLYYKRECKRMSEQGIAMTRPPVQDLHTLPLFHEIEVLKQQLQSSEYSSLPQFSKRQREVMVEIDNMHTASKTTPVNGDNSDDSEDEQMERHYNEIYKNLFPPSFSLYNEFLNLWSATVPVLTLLSSKPNTTASSSSGALDEIVENGEEVVEQEGCPEESDFNKWSHHCSVSTCDDELMQRAMGDDTTISFVFGLEVNWSLLLAKQEETREENEARKEQQRLDLEELNEKRRKQKEKSIKGTDSSDEDGVVVVEGSGKTEKNGKSKGNGKTKSEPKSSKSPKKKAPKKEVLELLDDPIDSDCSADVDAGILMPTQVASEIPKRSAAAAPPQSSAALAVDAAKGEVYWEDDEDDEEFDNIIARKARPTPPPPKSMKPPVVVATLANQSNGSQSSDSKSSSSTQSKRKRIIDDSDDDDDSVSALFQSTPVFSLDNNQSANVSSKPSAPIAMRKNNLAINDDSDDDDLLMTHLKPGSRPPLGKENKTVRSPHPKKSGVIIDITNTQAGPVVSGNSKQQSISQGEEWACHVCTFMNPSYSGSCDMCDSKRLGVTKRKRSQDSV